MIHRSKWMPRTSLPSRLKTPCWMVTFQKRSWLPCLRYGLMWIFCSLIQRVFPASVLLLFSSLFFGKAQIPRAFIDHDRDNFFQGSIPIYYGTSRVLEFFNPKAFIYCGQHAKRSVNHNIANVYVGQSQVPAWHFDECIKQIKEIDR